MNSWLSYNDDVAPLPSVIVVNTMTFTYGAWVTGFYCLFFCQWIFANINQGFILSKYYAFWRYMDYLNSLAIAYYLYHPSCAWCLFPTAVVFFWHIHATDRERFEFRVNVWHMYCCYLFFLCSS